LPSGSPGAQEAPDLSDSTLLAFLNQGAALLGPIAKAVFAMILERESSTPTRRR
jgi:hypothetical protein